MKRKLQDLVEDLVYQALENLDLEKTGEDAAKDAVREWLGDVSLEELVYTSVREKVGHELRTGSGLAVIVKDAAALYAEDIVRGWLS